MMGAKAAAQQQQQQQQQQQHIPQEQSQQQQQQQQLGPVPAAPQAAALMCSRSLRASLLREESDVLAQVGRGRRLLRG
jgi:hypothetical protein